MFECSKIIGRAVTIKITAAGMAKSKYHLGVRAIDAAKPGDVIAIDNRGDLYNNCWGEILSMGAKAKGVSGVVVDGARGTSMPARSSGSRSMPGERSPSPPGEGSWRNPLTKESGSGMCR